MTASSTGSPRYASASSLSCFNMREESSAALNIWFPSRKSWAVPICLLKEEALRSGWVCIFSLATVPVHRVPSLSMLTTLGVRNVPRELGISSARPCLQIDTRLLVVPRSIPIIAI